MNHFVHKIFFLSGKIAAFGSLLLLSSAVWADGVPRNWQLGFQKAASPVARQINAFHDYVVLPIIIGITLLVVGLLIYICFRFSHRRNPVPSKTTHNRNLEIIWTLIPALILGIIFVPSFYIHKFAYRADTIDMTLKVTGNQWYWSYEYPDHENVTFDSYILADDELKQGLRLLETDNPVVLPVNKNIRLLLTASDVLHNWAVPALGVRIDTVPGRLNETWVRIEKEGTYYGFCSELCGANHAYMPIHIEAVSEAEFNKWARNQ